MVAWGMSKNVGFSLSQSIKLKWHQDGTRGVIVAKGYGNVKMAPSLIPNASSHILNNASLATPNAKLQAKNLNHLTLFRLVWKQSNWGTYMFPCAKHMINSMWLAPHAWIITKLWVVIYAFNFKLHI